jgi:hypothetical protein
MHKADEPNALVNFLDAEFLTGQHGGDVDPLAMQAVPTAGGDEHVAVVERITEFRQAVIASRGRQLEFCGAFHLEGLMRPFGVELAQEGIEARLLLQAVAAWRSGRLLLEGEMHALMPAVLLRMTPINAGLLASPGSLESPHRRLH